MMPTIFMNTALWICVQHVSLGLISSIYSVQYIAHEMYMYLPHTRCTYILCERIYLSGGRWCLMGDFTWMSGFGYLIWFFWLYWGAVDHSGACITADAHSGFPWSCTFACSVVQMHYHCVCSVGSHSVHWLEKIFLAEYQKLTVLARCTGTADIQKQTYIEVVCICLNAASDVLAHKLHFTSTK